MKARARKTSKLKHGIIFLLCVAIIFISSYIGIRGLDIFGYRVQSFGEVIKKGLDLQGGVSIVEQVVSGNKDAKTLETTKEVLGLRVNPNGVSETTLTIEGTDKIRIDIPGKDDASSIIDTVSKPGKLTFKDPNGNVVLTGSDVKSASVGFDQNTSSPVVNLELNDTGTKKFADATRNNIGKAISIYMDETMVSSPTVNDAITNGKAIISNMQSSEEASKIANYIQSGALPVTLKNVETKTVGPTIGSVAIPLSLKAAVVGIAIVFLFMFIYYRVPGLLADLALILFILLTLLAFVVIDVTLSLPGIAGLLLTIGIAVDGNVLIFERIKEELRNGKSIRSSIDTGFHRALPSIVDSNTTTIISGVVLSLLGSGSVKGFAITLIIGTLFSMFTSIVITKQLVKLAFNVGFLNKPIYFGVKREE